MGLLAVKRLHVACYDDTLMKALSGAVADAFQGAALICKICLDLFRV